MLLNYTQFTRQSPVQITASPVQQQPEHMGDDITSYHHIYPIYFGDPFIYSSSVSVVSCSGSCGIQAFSQECEVGKHPGGDATSSTRRWEEPGEP